MQHRRKLAKHFRFSVECAALATLMTKPITLSRLTGGLTRELLNMFEVRGSDMLLCQGISE